MASLRECVRQHIDEFRGGFGSMFTIVWKNGRGWEAQTIKVNEFAKHRLYIDPKDSDRMREILNIDHRAVAVNIGRGDLCDVCDDGSLSIDTITRGVRSDYDNQTYPLSSYYDYVMRMQREKIEWMRSRYNAHNTKSRK